MYVKDNFLKNRSENVISDFHGNIFKLTYNGDKVEISEPQPYVSGNPYCQASAVILEDQPEKYKEIVEEAYEEFHERIQSIRP